MIASVVAHALVGAAIGWLLLSAVRWIQKQSTPVGRIVAAGAIARGVLGLALFWVSYLHLPMLRSLQLGGGFWVLMGDARGYYDFVTSAVDHGLQSVNSGGSSPFFVRALAVWMHVVGVSPAAGLYLNLCLYVGVLTLFVRIFKPANDWRRDLPCIVAAAAFSFSPAAVIGSTQLLKDDLFTALIVALLVGAWLLFDVLAGDERAGTPRSRALLGGGVLCGAIFCIAGIREYYAVIAWTALALVLGVFAFGQTRRRLARYAIGSLLVLGVGWLAYTEGAGTYYRGPTAADVGRAVRWPKSAPQPAAPPDVLSEALGAVDEARTGFALTGGATNIIVRERDEPSAGPVQSVRHRLRLVTIGLSIVFTPVSVLKELSIVEFTGGRGLLPLVDLDTVFLDLTMLWMLALLWTRRRSAGDSLPFILFAITLSFVTAVLLGYVVTNFGTLSRLRLLVAVPIWTLVIALSPVRRGVGVPARTSR